MKKHQKKKDTTREINTLKGKKNEIWKEIRKIQENFEINGNRY